MGRGQRGYGWPNVSSELQHTAQSLLSSAYHPLQTAFLQPSYFKAPLCASYSSSSGGANGTINLSPCSSMMPLVCTRPATPSTPPVPTTIASGSLALAAGSGATPSSTYLGCYRAIAPGSVVMTTSGSPVALPPAALPFALGSVVNGSDALGK
jgi:hypothetical protein